MPSLMETRFDELKRYVRFSDEDARLLRAFRPRAEPSFVRIAAEFYDRIREHEEAHAVFTGEEQIERLRRSLVAWLHRLLGGVYDEAYFDKTVAIGRVHVRVGLPQRYMFTAMALIRSSLNAIVDEGGTTCDDATATKDALSRLLDVELAIMVESYRDDMLSRIRRAGAIEREQLARRAELAEHRYVTAVEVARTLVIGLDGDGLIRLFNREAEHVTGYARDEALGLSFQELLLPEGTHLPENEGQHELPMRTRSGKIFEIRWQIARPPPTADDDVATFVIGVDVTEARAAHRRSQQQERLAAVGTLAAGLAHEIRNPLNGAQLHVAFLDRALRKVDVDEDAREAVKVVGDEIKRLARLVTEFLDFARPRALDLRPTSVLRVCERVLQLAPRNPAVDIVLDRPAADLMIEADRGRLEQVLLNLVQNAIEALADGPGGTVTVRVRREPLSARIEVEDDGPGLPSETAPIFDAFFSTKPNGTGLGLAIAHRIVTDHGGTIDVESRPGLTRFRIVLPLERSRGESA